MIHRISVPFTITIFIEILFFSRSPFFYTFSRHEEDTSQDSTRTYYNSL